MAKSDRFEELQSLIQQGITEKAELARRLGISRPTLYTMFDKLKEQGVDVFALAPVIIAPPPEKGKPGRPPGPAPVKPKTKKEVRDEVRQFSRLIDQQVNIIEQLNEINEKSRKALIEVETAAKTDTKLIGLVFKGCAEVRAQLEFASELVQMLYDAQAVQEFQEEVMEVIGSVDINVRREIERRLAERRSLRGAVPLPGTIGRGDAGAGE